MSLIDPRFSGWRRAIGFIGLMVVLPLIVIGIVFKLILLPFEKPAHRSTAEVARYLRDFIEGTGGEWDFDDFTSMPLADPRLEAIRDRAGRWPDGGDVSELWRLLEEAESITVKDRGRLIDLLRQVLAGEEVTPAAIDGALPYPRSLGVDERKAYAMLSRWADDEDIRTRDLDYAERQREQLAQQLALLSASSPA